MTTATKPLPPHGTPARYQGTRRTDNRPPCRCPRCVAAHSKACALREAQHLAGIPLRVPAAPITAHVQTLLTTMTCVSIAQAGGVSDSVVKHIARGLTPTVNRTTAEKILAVKGPVFAVPTSMVNPVGTERRIRALYTRGHGPRAIGDTVNRSVTAIKLIASGSQGAVTAATYQAIRDAYPQLATVEGSSLPAREWARKHGWRDPLWWEDMGGIDDPDFDPDQAERPLKRDDLAALRRDEILHLARFGYEPETIRQRLNDEVSISTVRDIVLEYRTGRKRDRSKKQAVAA